MEKFRELIDAANKKLKLADHILTMTYPIFKDPGLLLSSIENIFLAFTYGTSSLLYYEKVFKRIPPFPDNFESKLELFRDKCLKRYGIDYGYIKIMQEIKEIIIAHKKSPVEFKRKEYFIICDGDYRMRAISANIIKDYVGKAKLFIKNISAIISKDEAIFRH